MAKGQTKAKKSSLRLRVKLLIAMKLRLDMKRKLRVQAKAAKARDSRPQGKAFFSGGGGVDDIEVKALARVGQDRSGTVDERNGLPCLPCLPAWLSTRLSVLSALHSVLVCLSVCLLVLHSVC